MLSEEEAGVASTESPERLPMNVVAPEPLRHERGQGSNMSADISSTHVSEMYESEDEAVKNLDALVVQDAVKDCDRE